MEVAALNIGPFVKAKRTERGMTIADLAEKSGVSAGMLSEIESGKKCPTIRVVHLISVGLGCLISDLLDLPAAPAVRHEVVRRGEGRVLLDPESGVKRELLSPSLVRRGVQVLRWIVPPGGSTGEFAPEPPGVAEHVLVLRGRMEVRLNGEPFILEEGDALTCAADVTHEARNIGQGEAEFMLLVVSPKPGEIVGMGLS